MEETVRQGFEPWVPFKGYNALAKRRFRPLSHLTKDAFLSEAWGIFGRRFECGKRFFGLSRIFLWLGRQILQSDRKSSVAALDFAPLPAHPNTEQMRFFSAFPAALRT